VDGGAPVPGHLRGQGALSGAKVRDATVWFEEVVQLDRARELPDQYRATYVAFDTLSYPAAGPP
jgi:hypothetical protein